VPTAPAPRSQVMPLPGSRLEQLQAMYDDAEAKAKEAAERFDSIKKGIEAELAAAAPGARIIALGGPVPLTMSWRTPMRFDQKRFKEENTRLYVSYCKPGGHWELRRGNG
jgi:hypothetical protein